MLHMKLQILHTLCKKLITNELVLSVVRIGKFPLDASANPPEQIPKKLIGFILVIREKVFVNQRFPVGFINPSKTRQRTNYLITIMKAPLINE